MNNKVLVAIDSTGLPNGSRVSVETDAARRELRRFCGTAAPGCGMQASSEQVTQERALRHSAQRSRDAKLCMTAGYMRNARLKSRDA
jgi:hypothetical protein